MTWSAFSTCSFPSGQCRAKSSHHSRNPPPPPTTTTTPTRVTTRPTAPLLTKTLLRRSRGDSSTDFRRIHPLNKSQINHTSISTHAASFSYGALRAKSNRHRHSRIQRFTRWLVMKRKRIAHFYFLLTLFVIAAAARRLVE
jgi:hypothetical protein